SNPRFDIRVTNPDGQTSGLVGGTITFRTPFINNGFSDLESPAHYLSSNKFDYIVNSSTNTFIEFVNNGSTLPVVSFNSSDITVTSTTWTSSGTLRASIVIGNNIGGGPYNITVKNADGQISPNFSSFTIAGMGVPSVYQDRESPPHYTDAQSFDLVVLGS